MFKVYFVRITNLNFMMFFMVHICLQVVYSSSLTNIIEKPSFEDIFPKNVTIVVDDTAVLKCRVKNRGNRTVSWIRKRDLHILTTNIYTYTGDGRFSVIHPLGSEDWNLKIASTQIRDSGIYECQVNTEPKINLALSLSITERYEMTDNNFEIQTKNDQNDKAIRANIIGSSEVYVKKDSTIALTCSINSHVSNVLWYHGISLVDFDSSRGGISLETEKSIYGTTSRLMLTRAKFKDSGNYTCFPLGANPAFVRVHVLTGEKPAAMQTSGADILKISEKSNFIILLLKLYLLLRNSFINFHLDFPSGSTN